MKTIHFLPKFILPFCIFCFVSLSLCFAQPSFQCPRYNQVFCIATHNSYWIKRSHFPEPFASGTQERVLDQMLFDQARTLEIDIHKTRGQAGQWSVYHTGRHKNSLFQYFTDFLKCLQLFDYALPQHEVVTVVIELKEIFQKNWDRKHSPQDFNHLLETYLGGSLFRPSDLMARCSGESTLTSCVASNDTIWPTINALRGKFIFVVLGNFHWSTIGHGGLGWATYAASDNPSAFSMFSDFSVFNTKKITSEKIPTAILNKAYKASIFQQVENVNDKKHLQDIAEFINDGGVVRGGNSYSLQEQQERIRNRFQMLQTDYPWVHIRAKNYNQPFQPMDTSISFDPTCFVEPGHRIFVSGHSEMLWNTYSDSVSDWETLVSSTRPSPNPKYPNPNHPYGKGCLFAESDSLNQINICRQVDKQENVVITVKEIVDGVKKQFRFTSKHWQGKVGDYVRMQVVNNQDRKGTTVSLYSSSAMRNEQSPEWNLLHQTHFDIPVSKQGISADEGDVVFTGTKRNGVYFTKGEK